MARIQILASAATWTPELHRLAALIEHDLGARGLEPLRSEIQPPGVLAIVVRPGRESSLRPRYLRSILGARHYRRWPGLRLLWTDRDPGEAFLEVRATLSFSLSAPPGSTRSDADVAREIVRNHLAQRSGDEELARDLLGKIQIDCPPGDPPPAGAHLVSARLLYREANPPPRRIAAFCALLLARPRIEVRRFPSTPSRARAGELRGTASDATYEELNGSAQLRAAGLMIAPRLEIEARPFRLAADSLILAAGPALLGGADFTRIEARRDALGHAALGWTLTEPAAQRLARERSGSPPFAPLFFLVNGEVWAEMAIGKGPPKSGAIYGRFPDSLVELVARTFAPLDPPASYRLDSIQVR